MLAAAQDQRGAREALEALRRNSHCVLLVAQSVKQIQGKCTVIDTAGDPYRHERVGELLFDRYPLKI